MNECAGCGLQFPNLPSLLDHHPRRCWKLRHGRIGLLENEDSYRERIVDHESHTAEDREASQRSLGMLGGKSCMWWGNGRLM